MLTFQNFERFFLVLAAVLFVAFVAAAVADADEPTVPPIYAADTNADGRINLPELLRVVQFFNLKGYHACPGEGTKDGYCPGPEIVPATIDLAIAGLAFVPEALDDPSMDHLVVEVTANELPAAEFSVCFLVDNQQIACWVATPDSQSWLFGASIPETLLTPGIHIAKVVVDREGKISEIDEGNNEATVAFTVPEPLLVPDLTGLTMSAAYHLIEDSGLIWGEGSFGCSDTVAPSRVMGQDPAAGTEIEPGSIVNIIFSTGPCASEGEVEGIVEGEPEGTTEGSVEGSEEGAVEGETEGTTEGSVEGQEEGEDPCLDPIGLMVGIGAAEVVAGGSTEIAVSLNRGTCLVAGLSLAIPLPIGSTVSEYTLTEGFSNPMVNVADDVLLVSASAAEAVPMSGEFFTFIVTVPETVTIGAFDLGFVIDDTIFYATNGTEVGVALFGGVLEILPATEEGEVEGSTEGSVEGSEEGEVEGAVEGEGTAEGQVEGETGVSIPDFSNLSWTFAQDLAEVFGFVCEEGYLDCSDTVEPNHVMSQEPLPGTVVPAGTEIFLTLSSGPCYGEGEIEGATEGEGTVDPPTYTITTEVTMVGGNPVGSVELSPVGPYVAGTVVTLTATPIEGYVFVGWYDNFGGGFISSDNPLVYIVGELDVTIVATFQQDAPETYTVTTEVYDGIGGTAEVSPAGPYETGTVVTLTATPAEGYVFDSWHNVTTGEQLNSVNPLQYTVTDEDVVIMVTFREAGVAVPTITFECPTAEGRVPVTIQLPVGDDLHNYLCQPIGEIRYIVMAGPEGNWVKDYWTTENRIVKSYVEISEQSEIINMTTRFETWPPFNFEGNLFAVDVDGKVGWFALDYWMASFGANQEVIVPDGYGGEKIRFAAGSGGCK